MTADRLPLPTFLVIGAQKSATRWLRSHLGEQREVFTSSAEISFFNHDVRFALGEDWYRSQFDGWSGEAIVGESTPGYLMWRHQPAVVAERIHETIPDVRLLAVLRDPIERGRSAVVHHRRRERLRPSAGFEELALSSDPHQDRLGIVAGGWYASSLEPFIERFGDQLLVLLHDDVRDDPVSTFRKALDHVGASASEIPRDLSDLRFSNRMGDNVNPDRLRDTVDRSRLLPLFAEEINRLEVLLDRDLAAWRSC